jgi:DNA-binding response OmpR family regulator
LSANSKTRLLLVDDEPDITTVFKQGLVSHGYSVDAFTDPELALGSYEPSSYDRIIIDIRMPKMNGFELARAMWHKDPDAKICFMTAFEIFEEEAEKVFKDLQTRCFLKKPMSPTGLVEHIEKHSLNA